MEIFAPNKRSEEFLEKLARENPVQARRFARYMEIKKRLHTAEHAYQRLQYTELIEYVNEKLKAHLNDNVVNDMLAEHAASIWFVNQLIYEKGVPIRNIEPLDYNPLTRIGVHSIDDLVTLAVEYRQKEREEEDKENDNLVRELSSRLDCSRTAIGFDIFLVQKLNECLSEEDKEDSGSYVNAGNASAIFPRLFCEDDECRPAMVDEEKYYLQQFKRLEREQRLYTEDAESIFLPILKKAYSTYNVLGYISELGERIGSKWLKATRGTLDAQLIKKIIHFADPHLPITPDELRIALRKDLDNKKENGMCLAISLKFVDLFESYAKNICRKQPEYLPIREDSLEGEYDDPAIQYGARLAYRTAYNLLVQMPLKEVEHRYSHFSAITHDAVAAERFTSYLFQLARRRRVQLENTMKS
ncbi:hypothetical protein J4206_06305 [Candidatus Woesearchaeota archaeon]|nr:hypothetical protein [Candidatus Woesearchaeota archaeon]